MLNALTIDVEDWYHTNGLNIPIEAWDDYEDRVYPNTLKVLDLLDRYEVKGTFFVLGCVAVRHPELIKEIACRGHEIGSHGGWHQMLTQLTLKEFQEDVIYSKRVLEEISGQKVVLYRAPSWSITPDKYEALRILEEEGFVCDSSIQPFHTPLSGIRNAPHRPFYPIINGKRLSLLEFPSTVYKWGKWSIPFSGGFYLRVMSMPFITWALKQVNREQSGMVYLHPWEFDLQQPRLNKKIPLLIKLAQYYNIHSTERKLEKLLQRFQFVPLGQLIQSQQHPEISLN